MKTNPRATETIAADPLAGVDWHPTVVNCRCHLYKLYIREGWCPPPFPPFSPSPRPWLTATALCDYICVEMRVCGYQMLAMPTRERDRPSKVGPPVRFSISHFPMLADFGRTTVIDVIKLEIYAMPCLNVGLMFYYICCFIFGSFLALHDFGV